MQLNAHVRENKNRQLNTESERLGNLRAEAAKIVGQLRRGELSEEEAVKALDRLSKGR